MQDQGHFFVSFNKFLEYLKIRKIPRKQDINLLMESKADLKQIKYIYSNEPLNSKIID